MTTGDRGLPGPDRGVYHVKETREPGMSEPADDEKRDLPPAARRALAEAEARRKADAGKAPPPKEMGGRDGPDPVRYGDWEKKGIAIDF